VETALPDLRRIPLGDIPDLVSATLEEAIRRAGLAARPVTVKQFSSSV